MTPVDEDVAGGRWDGWRETNVDLTGDNRDQHEARRPGCLEIAGRRQEPRRGVRQGDDCLRFFAA